MTSKTTPKNRSKTASKAKTGRPTKFTQAIADEICERIMQGEPVRQITLLEHLPSEGTVYRWLNDNEVFQQQYARAKEAQAERFAEELLEIADDGTNDWIERESQRTGQKYTALNDEAVARSRLRVEARKWLMGKMKPKKYGDAVKVSGDPEAPLNPVQPIIQFVRYGDTADDAANPAN